jgi:hypothetical protein
MSSFTDSSSLNAALDLQVKLSDDFAKYGDADEGPLSLGDIGTLVEDDGSSKPYKVRSAAGKLWWYQKEAIVKVEARNLDACLFFTWRAAIRRYLLNLYSTCRRYNLELLLIPTAPVMYYRFLPFR